MIYHIISVLYYISALYYISVLGLCHFTCLTSNIPESPASGVFVSQFIRYVMLEFVGFMKIFLFRGSILVSKLLKRDILHGNFRLLFGNSMFVTQILLTNLTLLCHIC